MTAILPIDEATVMLTARFPNILIPFGCPVFLLAFKERNAGCRLCQAWGGNICFFSFTFENPFALLKACFYSVQPASGLKDVEISRKTLKTTRFVVFLEAGMEFAILIDYKPVQHVFECCC